MKLFKTIIGGVCMVSVAIVGVKMQKIDNEVSSAVLANVEALSSYEGESGSAGGDLSHREGCINSGGNWDMASVLSQSGFESVECRINGEISFMGVTLKAEYYKKGSKYPFAWASYKCEPSPGNCCTKQGLYSGDTKLA